MYRCVILFAVCFDQIYQEERPFTTSSKGEIINITSTTVRAFDISLGSCTMNWMYTLWKDFNFLLWFFRQANKYVFRIGHSTKVFTLVADTLVNSVYPETNLGSYWFISVTSWLVKFFQVELGKIGLTSGTPFTCTNSLVHDCIVHIFCCRTSKKSHSFSVFYFTQDGAGCFFLLLLLERGWVILTVQNLANLLLFPPFFNNNPRNSRF